MISISCLESKLLNNNNWYGRFQLAPFQKGEGLTVANALRRTLLAEKSNLFITWVDFYNAEIPYSVLTGMRESIFDILLNLKQVIFTSDKIIPNRSPSLNSPSTEGFKPQKVKFLSKKRLKVESEINFLDSDSHTFTRPSKEVSHDPKQSNLNLGPNDINNRTIGINQTLKNQNDQVKNVFCKNQVLGKMINSNHEVSPLARLGILSKTSIVKDQFEDTPNSKKMANSTYIGYICAKGPTIIYAKNLKLPKGLKCVDPDKYIVTLADDGLFYLRFALTTYGPPPEIKTVASTDRSNLSISITKGIEFNNVRLKRFPKTLFNKEMQSCSSFRTILSMTNKEEKLKKPNQQYLNNNQRNFNESHSIAKNRLSNLTNHYSLFRHGLSTFSRTIKPEITKQAESDNYYKQNDPSFSSRHYSVKRKIPWLSQIKLYNSKIDRVNYTYGPPPKNLIKQQRLLLTNDSIKSSNFQNTSIIANIQKTCLLNIQVKHYYYKCGRFDRFLFDLIKLFKPSLKSTYYNFFSLKENLLVHSLFYKNNSLKRSAIELWLCLDCNNSRSQIALKHKELKHEKIGRLENNIKKKHLISKLLNSSSFQNHINLFSDKLQADEPSTTRLLQATVSPTPARFEVYRLKNQYLLKWQKTFKFSKTNSIYDYFKKSSKSQAALQANRFISLLSTKPCIETKISLLSDIVACRKNFNMWSFFGRLKIGNSCRKRHGPINKKLISISKYNVLNMRQQPVGGQWLYRPLPVEKNLICGFIFSSLHQNIEQFLSFIDHRSKMLKLHKPYIEKFLTYRPLPPHRSLALNFSFHDSKNHILWFLKAYILQHNEALDFLNQNPVSIENLVPFSKHELTYNSRPHIKIFSTGHSLLAWMNENKKPKHDYHLREFYYSGSKEGPNGSKRISGYRLSYNFFHKKSSEWPFFGLIKFNIINRVACKFNNSLFRHSYSLYSRTIRSINQPWIYLNKYKSFNSVPLPTTLRTKPASSIRQVSYKPMWIFSCHFQQNTNLKKFWLDHLNSNSFVYTQQAIKNQFLNASCLAKKNHGYFLANRPSSMRKTLNSIPANNVTLKPIYLNVSQIIYILKQTTKFCKNQRINPKFFNSFRKLIDHCPNNDKSFPADYYLRFSKVSNFLYNSLSKFSDPKTIKIKPTKGLSFVNLLVHSIFGLKNLHNKLITYKPEKNKNTKDYQTQIINNRSWPISYTRTLVFSNVWVFGNNFVFKNNLLDASFKSKSHLLYRSKGFYIPLKPTGHRLVFGFFKPLNRYQHALNKLMVVSLMTFPYFPRIAMTNSLKINNLSNELYRPLSNRLFSDSPLLDRPPPKKPLSVRPLPYNINIYNSKISFNLRYSYPFKYTIFETFLPFQSITSSSTKMAQMFISNQRKNERFQASKKYKEQMSLLNSTMTGYRHFDSIHYNESFKIYTSLAYTCLKTYEPHLSKYHNFNKRNQKKLQEGNFKITRFQQPCFKNLNYGVVPSLTNLQTTTRLLTRSKNKYLLDKISKTFYRSTNMYELVPYFKLMTESGFTERSLSEGSLKNFDLNNDSLPSIFDSTSKWRIINNPNFNDAFIIIPCTRSLNSIKWPVNNSITLDASPNITDWFYSFVFEVQNNFFGTRKEIIKNKLYWSGTYSLSTQNSLVRWKKRRLTNRAFTGIQPYEKKNSTFNVGSTNYDETIDNSKLLSSGVLKSKHSYLKDLSRHTAFVENRQVLPDDLPLKVLWSETQQKVLKRSLKKLAINFETIYYKNFLWNSKKITLRILNNAVLPLVANRKSNISHFVPEKNYYVSHFINRTMVKTVSFNRNFSKPFVESHPIAPVRVKRPEMSNNFQQKLRPDLNSLNNDAWTHKNFNNIVFGYLVTTLPKVERNLRRENKSTRKITENKLYQSSLANKLLEIDNYQTPQFYSIRHKIFETTNFMCEKTYLQATSPPQATASNFINQDETQRIIQPEALAKSEESLAHSDSTNRLISSQTMSKSLTDKWQKQGFDDFFESGFSSLSSKTRPFFYGSLKHSQAKKISDLETFWPIGVSQKNTDGAFPDSSLQEVQWKTIQEKDLSSKSPFVHFLSRKKQQSENNEKAVAYNSFLSYNQTTPEKLASFRKRQWNKRLAQGSKLSNQSKISSITDLKANSPLNNNLWRSSFFGSYSLYAISTKSDLFLQNLINFFGLKNQIKWPVTKDGSDFFQPENTSGYTSWTPNSNEIKKNLDEPVFFKEMQSQSKQNDTHQLLNIKSSIKSYEKTIQKILKSQDYALINDFVPDYYYKWQKTIHITILNRLKTLKLTGHRPSSYRLNEKKNFDSVPQNSPIILENNYYDFGNPLRRTIRKESLTSFTIKSSIKLDTKFTTRKLFLRMVNKNILKSWKSMIYKAEANRYFCFHYPLYIKNCNLPWKKSKLIFGLSKHWSGTFTLNRAMGWDPNKKTIHLKLYRPLPSSKSISFYLSKCENVNKEINNNLSMFYTQLASSSNKTHKPLLAIQTKPIISLQSQQWDEIQPFQNLTSSLHIHIQNQGSYGTIGYFTIKEGLNSIYKVNYIVESHISESKPISELDFHSNQKNSLRGQHLIDLEINKERERNVRSHGIKRFETIQRDSVITDSLTVSNFLNDTYSFVPSKTIMLNRFNLLIDPSINRSQIQNEDEYIQIDIWTNGELTPRQALLNAFKKLFELFYNLSKYNCLKPIEI